MGCGGCGSKQIQAPIISDADKSQHTDYGAEVANPKKEERKKEFAAPAAIEVKPNPPPNIEEKPTDEPEFVVRQISSVKPNNPAFPELAKRESESKPMDDVKEEPEATDPVITQEEVKKPPQESDEVVPFIPLESLKNGTHDAEPGQVENAAWGTPTPHKAGPIGSIKREDPEATEDKDEVKTIEPTNGEVKEGDDKAEIVQDMDC